MLIGKNFQVVLDRDTTEGWGNGHGKAVVHPKPSGAHWGAAWALGFAFSLLPSLSHPTELQRAGRAVPDPPLWAASAPCLASHPPVVTQRSNWPKISLCN